MVLRKILILGGLALFITFAITGGCKDIGSEPPPAPVITSIVPSADTVGAEVRIEGQNFGSSQAGSYVMFNTITATNYSEWRDDEIRVLVPGGATTGLVKAVVEGRESNGVQFQVVVAPGIFGVPQNIVNLVAGDSLVQTISGGTLPYIVVSQTNSSAAVASIGGNSLTITAVAAGSSTVIIGDNGAQQLTDTVVVAVSTLISFAGQIQPIFNGDCAQTCHPGGGAPFSLRTGESYNNLVDVLSTTVPCANTLVRVKRFSADSSALYLRVTGTTCGAQMPLDGPPYLSTSEQNLISGWINQGARNN